jgi:hypothetical protein
MAITSTYPIIVPKGTDLIVGTQTYTAADPVLDNPTRNFTVQSIADMVAVEASNGITSFQAGSIIANTLKIGITSVQAGNILINTAKVGITPAQASSIVTNSTKVSYTDSAAVAVNTLKNTYPSVDATKLSGVEVGADVNTVNSSTTGEPTGSDVVLNIVSLTQAEYDAGTKIATTLYVIV